MHCPSLPEHVAIVQGTRVTHTGMAGTLFTWRKSLNKRWASCRPWEPRAHLHSHCWQLQPQAWIIITSQLQEVRLHNLCVLPAGTRLSLVEKKAGGNPCSHFDMHRPDHKKRKTRQMQNSLRAKIKCSGRSQAPGHRILKPILRLSWGTWIRTVTQVKNVIFLLSVLTG